MSTFPKCPLCGSDKTATYEQRSALGGFKNYHVTCRTCKMTTTVPAHPGELGFEKYAEKDLIEMLVAVGLLTEYPETIAYVSQLQKDLEAAIGGIVKRRKANP